MAPAVPGGRNGKLAAEENRATNLKSMGIRSRSQTADGTAGSSSLTNARSQPAKLLHKACLIQKNNDEEEGDYFNAVHSDKDAEVPEYPAATKKAGEVPGEVPGEEVAKRVHKGDAAPGRGNWSDVVASNGGEAQRQCRGPIQQETAITRQGSGNGRQRQEDRRISRALA